MIQQVRDRSTTFQELKNAHHFVFDRPLDPSYQGNSEFVWLSVHPGEGDDDWEICNQFTEETRDYNFQLDHGPSRGSQSRIEKMLWFLGDEMFSRTTLTMLFYWSVSDSYDAIKSRFGYTFSQNPHWDFCTRTNLELIHRIRPRAVFAESRPGLKYYEHEFGLSQVKTYCDTDGYHILEQRQFEDGTPFFCFDNLSARRGHSEVRQLVHKLIHEID